MVNFILFGYSRCAMFSCFLTWDDFGNMDVLKNILIAPSTNQDVHNICMYVVYKCTIYIYIYQNSNFSTDGPHMRNFLFLYSNGKNTNPYKPNNDERGLFL